MSDRSVQQNIEDDLQDAATGRGRVLYLEGKSDVSILLALLGAGDERIATRGVLHDGVLLRHLNGSTAVAQHLAVAHEHNIRGIFGVLDGDGDPLTTLAAGFDPPHAGPRFRWKGYCIENLLARTPWPDAWGAPPDWREVLASFAPYVAINRLGTALRTRLDRVGLLRLINPTSAQAPRDVDSFLAVLRTSKHELANLEIESLFAAELGDVNSVLDTGLDAAHALVNGKWLVDAFAARRTNLLRKHECRDAWTAHLRATGGDPETLAWWRRTIAP